MNKRKIWSIYNIIYKQMYTTLFSTELKYHTLHRLFKMQSVATIF